MAAAGPHAFWLGTWEHHKQVIFSQHLAVGDIVYDIGAHAGLYTLLASRRVSDAGHVYAFEPLPQNLAYLRAHLDLNRVHNTTVVPQAVADRSEPARFSPGETDATGHLDREGSLEVETWALDEALDAGMLRPPTVLKIDVEGGEQAVLVGAANLLRSVRPTIFLATHGVDQHAACCRLLCDHGYELCPLDSSVIADARELLAIDRLARRPSRGQ